MDSRTVNTRIPADVLARIDADADRLGLTRTAMLLRPWTHPDAAPPAAQDPAPAPASDVWAELKPEYREWVTERAQLVDTDAVGWLTRLIAQTRKRIAAEEAESATGVAVRPASALVQPAASVRHLLTFAGDVKTAPYQRKAGEPAARTPLSQAHPHPRE